MVIETAIKASLTRLEKVENIHVLNNSWLKIALTVELRISK